MIKRISLFCLALTMLVTSAPNNVKATDFDGQEDKYIKLCSSSKLTNSQQNTCKNFNKYLKEKNKDINKEIKESKEKISDAKESIEDIKTQIVKLDDEIETAEKEIDYIKISIKKIEKEIKKNEKLMEERLYVMQSMVNSNQLSNFLFGSEDFTDFFSRVDAINDITEYDNELIDKLIEDKKEVEEQKKEVTNYLSLLESKKKKQKELQTKYLNLINSTNNEIDDLNKEKAQYTESMDKIKENLDALEKASQESKVDGVYSATGGTKVGRAIANKALTKLGYMYLWGGCHTMNEIKNPNTTRFDCSGLVCWAHYQCGVNIGVQYTGSLVYMGQKVSKSNIQAGDIILFSNNGSLSGIHHVGIYIGNNQMVHAPSTGKPIQVANLSNAYWQKEWYVARRLY